MTNISYSLTDIVKCEPLVFPHVKLNSSAVSVGASVSVSCDEGYMPAGGSPIVTCLNTGIWSAQIPLCVGTLTKGRRKRE